ncbi:hypothetical protein HPP92_006093 [Vanilla planifolia]|uniref:Uncharacterized protein n=1 Tax=Vanilla planifolia TaxID=51239 RepID=A0A835VBZ8_VANPL|nr:hypothetical protein HPP92_006409 [Vanilla planifolia]KAG0495099.1 hypothetical protein HPP92_006093 [Vanilla planifolia]
MAVSKLQKLLLLSLALSLFFTPSSSAAFCIGRLGCFNGARRFPYIPPPPQPNRQYRSTDPRSPPVQAQDGPPSPSTIA